MGVGERVTKIGEVYTDEIKDLWSANDQMIKALTTLSSGVHDVKLKKHFEEALAGIGRHNDTLKFLLQDAGEEVEKEHCRGMEGLCREALKHGVKEAPEDGELKDIVIVTQYQRMCHYGITGFGSAAAIAKALGMKDHVTKLQAIVADIYGADELTSQMAEKLTKLAAKHAKAAS
jgi:ferritin-like metal-binding protein YciE